MKNFVYFDYGGSHTSVIAAGIHAGLLDPHNPPDDKALSQFPYFDKTTPDDFGKMKHLGTHPEGHRIYCLGTKSSTTGPLLEGMAELQNAAGQFIFCDTMPYVNTTLRIGGWLSRGIGLSVLGRPLVYRGIRKEYGKIADFVKACAHHQGGNKN